MPKLDICHAMVQTDDYTKVARGATNPLNWAEVELLLFMFGERAVTEIVVVDTVERTNEDILMDLRLKYGAQNVSEAFPGQRPRLPKEAPEDVERLGKPKAKPRKSRRATPAPDSGGLADAVVPAPPAEDGAAQPAE